VRLGPGKALRKAFKDLTSGPHMRIAFLEEVLKRDKKNSTACASKKKKQFITEIFAQPY